MRASAVILIVVTAPLSCKDDAPDPESVPFEGLDPAVQPKRPKVTPAPEPEPSSSAETAAPRPVPKPSVQVGKLSSCCAALAAVARTSPDPGQRNNAAAASRVCVTKASEVKQGSLSESVALSQVRSSILGGAPGACR